MKKVRTVKDMILDDGALIPKGTIGELQFCRLSFDLNDVKGGNRDNFFQKKGSDRRFIIIDTTLDGSEYEDV